MVMPRLHQRGEDAGGISLPLPLAPSEAARLERIFRLQRAGAVRDASMEMDDLRDQLLTGDVLAARFLARPRRTPVRALVEWLNHYPDLPDAPAIRAILMRRLPAGAPVPPADATASLGAAGEADAESAGAQAARREFTAGKDGMAWRLGQGAWVQSSRRDGHSAYVAGLAAWRLGALPAAAGFFEAASLAPDADGILRAAGAFWAARVHERERDLPGWIAWMRRAAAEPHALHGMLARRVLGMNEPAPPPRGVLTEADLDALMAMPAGRRAFALLQIGERGRAEAELRHLWPVAQADQAIARALMLVAEDAGLTGLQDDLGSALHLAGSDPDLPRLRPRGGYFLNPALVYAVARVESSFAEDAVSPAGALGLMQLRPAAAVMVAGPETASLMDPGTNLRLGQRFLAWLAQASVMGDNLLRVLAAYNAGPAAAQKLDDAGGDPVLFLETIPADETRHYVTAALTYLGAYQQRMGTASPALDTLAAGLWPRFSREIKRAGQ